MLAASIVVTPLVLPYTLALSPSLAKILTPTILVAQVVQAAVLFSVAVFVGLLLADKVGLGAPILEGMLRGKNQGGYLKSILGLSIGMGVLGALLVILLSLLFLPLSASFLKAETSVETWKAFLASFYGGIAEEVLCRLFLMTLLAWVLSSLERAVVGRRTDFGIWLSIVLSAILFGLGHLGITGHLTAITSTVVLRAVLLNGAPGTIFGWLYWRKGLESAMIAHFSADIVLHVITPLIASIFI